MQERGRPRYPEKFKQELSLRTAALLSEISQKSGKKPAELEKIFKIGAGGIDSDTAGKYWRRLKNGERNLPADTERRVQLEALDKGWLDGKSWGFDALLGPLMTDENLRKKKAAEKIEKHLRQIIHILNEEMPGDTATILFYTHQIGKRLGEMYKEDMRNCMNGWGELAETVEKTITDTEREAELLLQICSTESEKS